MWAASARLHAVANRVCGLRLGVRVVKCVWGVVCGDVCRACALTWPSLLPCPFSLFPGRRVFRCPRRFLRFRVRVLPPSSPPVVTRRCARRQAARSSAASCPRARCPATRIAVPPSCPVSPPRPRCYPASPLRAAHRSLGTSPFSCACPAVSSRRMFQLPFFGVPPHRLVYPHY
jgi:hypothetical protein